MDRQIGAAEIGISQNTPEVAGNRAGTVGKGNGVIGASEENAGIWAFDEIAVSGVRRTRVVPVLGDHRVVRRVVLRAVLADPRARVVLPHGAGKNPMCPAQTFPTMWTRLS
ncbi:MAG: hypothetical protein ACRDSP_23600 [Pseudonocardiaceae bacterium]